MANLSTIAISALDGSVVQVSADGVYRITHGFDEAGTPHVLVDFDGGQQETDESVAKLLTDLQAAKVTLVRFTTPVGLAVYINPEAVTAIQAAQAGEDAPGARAAITVGGHHQAVVETPDEVRAALGVA